MRRRRKLTRKDFEPEPSAVWTEENNVVMPTPFFLRWWQRVAQRRFSNKERWLEVAQELGYVARNGEAIGFDYDPLVARASLGIPEHMPLMREAENSDSYKGLMTWLLSERREHGQ